MSSQPAAIKQNYQRALPKEENKVQENSTKFAKHDILEEKESHDKLVRLAASEVLSLSEKQLQEVIRRFYAVL
jgi:hypothetical protein